MKLRQPVRKDKVPIPAREGQMMWGFNDRSRKTTISVVLLFLKEELIMSSYCAITGEIIDLNILPRKQKDLAMQIIRIAQTSRPTSSDGDKSSADQLQIAFAKEASNTIAEVAPSRITARELLGGPVGVIYRDCFYRLLARQKFLEKKEDLDEGTSEHLFVDKFLRQLTHNPARILLDDLLIENTTQGQFAAMSGLNLGEVFKFVVGESNESSLTVDQLREACQRCSIVPVASSSLTGPEATRLEKPLVLRTQSLTTRDLQLARLCGQAARIEDHKARRAFLGINLALIYKVRDFDTLRWLVEVIEAATQTSALPVELSEDLTKNRDVVLAFDAGDDILCTIPQIKEVVHSAHSTTENASVVTTPSSSDTKLLVEVTHRADRAVLEILSAATIWAKHTMGTL